MKGQYDEKCDIWSIGVILYILLSGRPPFDGQTDDEILNNVRKGDFSLSGSEWKQVSKEAKDLIKGMLTKDKDSRMAAETALKHPWIQKKVKEPIDKSVTLAALGNLRTFRVRLTSNNVQIGRAKVATSSCNLHCELVSFEGGNARTTKGI